jgi:serine/threonine-protein kinase
MEFSQLGPYRIERKLGEGAMGAVYLGVHEDTGEPAAVKLLAAALVHQQGFRVRFESEIETLRKLDHPNIVKMFGFGDYGEMMFYAMEFVEGDNLDDVLDEGKLFTWRQVVDIGKQICAALKHAHDRGVIHRDLKPANLMITADGTLKLADFGIARLYGHSGMTVAGGPIGTATYMSPEQTEGDKVTERSDLYSLGCVFYALLSGRPPFKADTLPAMLRMQQTQIPERICERVPDVPEELDLIIARLLEKKPEDRIPTAATLARSLDAVVDAVKLRERTQTPTTKTNEPISRSRIALGNADATLDSAAPSGDTYELADSDATLPSAAGNADATLASSPPAKQDSTVQLDDGVYELDEPQALAKPSTVFITREEAERHDREMAEAEAMRRPRIISTGTIFAIVALIGVAALTTWLMRPPTETKLVARIDALIEDGSDESIEQADDRLRELARIYPDNERLNDFESVREEAKFIRLERKLRNRAKRLWRARPETPIERTFLEAMNAAQEDPGRGLTRFRALVDLYSNMVTDEETNDYIVLAKRQIERLQAQIDQYAADHVALLDERLDRAEQLVDVNPDAAAAICNAVIALYDEKPWASHQVERAAAIMSNTASQR